MMNLIQVQDDLKNFSQDQLVKEMQQPSGSTPQFLVLAELNRRRRVKGDYEARQSQNQPTVAQEAIASAGVPQEGMMGMPEAMAPQSAVSEGVGTSAPMNMASGGLMQFGNEIRESMGQEIDPYLDGVQQEAEQKFNIDLDNQTGLMQMPGPRIPMLPQPFYSGHRGPGSPGTMQYIDAQRPLPPQERLTLGIGGKGAIRPAVMPRGGTGVPFGRQDRRFAEGGVVKAANGLSLADRNMNPGNIRPAGFMGETSGQGGYAGYASPEFGLRAMSRLSGTYANKGITTVRDFINRYAPPSDNNKNNDNYAKMVADSLGVGVDDPIDFSKPSVKEALIPAIAKFEGYTGDLGPNLIKSAVAASETEDVTDVNELLSGIDSLSGDKSGGEKLTADLSFPTAGNMGARNIDLGNIFGISSANASTESAQSLDDKLMAEDATDKLDPKTLKMLQDSGNLTELDFVTGKSDPNIFGKILGKQPTIKDDIDKFKDNRVDGGFAAFQDPLFVNRFKQKQGLPARSNQDVYSDGYGEQSNLNILDTIKSPIIKKI